MNETCDARQIYWLAFRCPCCGILARASTALRAWEAGPEAKLDEQVLLTTSRGPGLLTNHRRQLAEHLRPMPYSQRRDATRLIEQFFQGLERRLELGARQARAAAYRSRTL